MNGLEMNKQYPDTMLFIKNYDIVKQALVLIDLVYK